MKTHKFGPVRCWAIMLAAFTFFFYSFVQINLFSTQEMKEYFGSQLGVSDPAAFGNLAAGLLYASVLFLIPAGLLLDRFSVKWLLTGLSGAMAACVLATAFVNNYGLAVGLRFLTGVAYCIAFLGPIRLAPRFVPQHLALALGLMGSLASFGGIVAGAPMQWLLERFGGQTTLLLNAALGAAVFALMLMVVRDYPGDESAQPAGADSVPILKGLWQAAQNPQNWLAGLFIGLINLSVFVLGAVWGTNYLSSTRPSLSSESCAGIVGMIFFGAMIALPLWGRVSDALGNRRGLMLVGAIASLTIMLLIMFPPAPGTWLLYGLFLALGLAAGSQVIGYPVIAESNDERLVGTANGLATTLVMAAGAVAQPLLGFLVGVFGGETMGGYQKAIWLMPVCFAIALLCAVLTRETCTHQ